VSHLIFGSTDGVAHPLRLITLNPSAFDRYEIQGLSSINAKTGKTSCPHVLRRWIAAGMRA
jgi:hypothetical protein